LSAKAISELEETLEAIWNGSLTHSQSSYFNDSSGYGCESSACLAGWLVLRYGPTSTPDSVDNAFSMCASGVDSSMFPSVSQEAFDAVRDPDEWWVKRWGITNAEASLLFDANSVKRLHKLTLDAFKSGKRLKTVNDSYLTISGSNGAPDYLGRTGGAVLLEPSAWGCDKKYLDDLRAFLGEEFSGIHPSGELVEVKHS
ncbi:MAG: hypothetical protein AAFY17_12575, partial [Cyanobacteria bacterium J06642_11]